MGLLIEFVEVKYFVDNCREQGEGYEDCETDLTYYIWHGYLYAVTLFAFLSVYSLMLSGYFEAGFLLGMDVRTALIDLVYRCTWGKYCNVEQ